MVTVEAQHPSTHRPYSSQPRKGVGYMMDEVHPPR